MLRLLTLGHLRTGVSAVALAVLLTACGGGGNGRPPGVVLPPDPPEPPPPAGEVSVERVFPLLSFVDPVAMLQAPGDSSLWFVVEQRGVVQVFSAATPSSTAEFMNIISRVDSGASEAGLLGFAFDPDFATNGYVYASFTTAGPFRSVVSRFTLDAATGTVAPASEVVILEVAQPESNHNGGHLAFGDDGNLYVALGDGGGGGDPFDNGQDTTTLLGTILRLDVSSLPGYGIPDGNPFRGETECVGGSGTANCPEIFAWGFRNPWRFSFDRQTGELWAGDVGQGNWEEIDLVTAGQNYGWNVREGANCFPPSVATCDETSVDPITEYPHGDGFSVTGGYVYRGSDFPDLVGQYIFGDFVTGRIWRVPADAAQGTAPVELARTMLNISSFGEGTDGELYVVDYRGGLYRIVSP